MKTSVLIPILFLLACSSKPVTQEVASENSLVTENQDAIPTGLQLITESDCQTCHHTSNNLIGPAYQAIANKYEPTDENIKLLSTKIINGGSGVWGNSSMNAHGDVSEQDAREMVSYILSLKE
jgi:cytochrome c